MAPPGRAAKRADIVLKAEQVWESLGEFQEKEGAATLDRLRQADSHFIWRPKIGKVLLLYSRSLGPALASAHAFPLALVTELVWAGSVFLRLRLYAAAREEEAGMRECGRKG